MLSRGPERLHARRRGLLALFLLSVRLAQGGRQSAQPLGQARLIGIGWWAVAFQQSGDVFQVRG
jgi:hypothetical protein